MDIKLTIEAPQLAEAISKLADALQGDGLVSTESTKKATSTKKQTAPKVEDAPKEEPQTKAPEVGDKAPEVEDKAPEVEDKAPEVTPEPEEKTDSEAEVIDAKTVRAYLQKLSDAGRQKEAKGIITSMGFTKLSDIPEERRAEAIERVKELLGDE